MSNTQIKAQAHSGSVNRAFGPSAWSSSVGDVARANNFPAGSSYNDRPFGGVSRQQLELLRYANLQALMILARD
jgi:hypothetical protein